MEIETTAAATTLDVASITKRVRKLKIAKNAYFNCKSPVMGDAIYDAEEEVLRREDPANEFFDEIGETPEDAVQLPVPMPSLKKVKPDEASFGRFIKRTKGPYVCSDKLDGISALWVSSTGKLYLRGDGTKGLDVSPFKSIIQGLRPVGAVRGELLIRKADAEGAANLRSIVNGALHRKEVKAVTPQIRFVAYQVIEPTGLTRSQQFTWLAANGYEVPVWAIVASLKQDELAAYWNKRRTESIYELDGIVVGIDAVPEKIAFGDSYPDDTVAFKMPLAEQCAATTVKTVHWTGTRLGILAPRIEIVPVVIGGARIQFVTGHNAKYISDEKIGPGAKVIIRRSGDVIPIVDFVEASASSGHPQLPPAGTWTWEGVHAKATGTSIDTTARQILHYMRSIGVSHVGEASIRSLIEGGIDGIMELGMADREDFQKILGPTTGGKLYDGLHAAEAEASELAIWRGCPLLPAGIGEKRWQALFDVYPDPATWDGAEKPAGWNEGLWNDFQTALPDALAWRQVDLDRIPMAKPAAGGAGTGGAGAGSNSQAAGSYVTTGFRDKSLAAIATAKGWQEASTVTKKVAVIIIPNSENPKTYASTKVAKARELNIPIMRCADFIAANLS
jgi:DNA ligase (NAD+)